VRKTNLKEQNTKGIKHVSYIYVYSSRRQNTALNRDKNRQTDRQTDTQTLQLILQHDIKKENHIVLFHIVLFHFLLEVWT